MQICKSLQWNTNVYRILKNKKNKKKKDEEGTTCCHCSCNGMGEIMTTRLGFELGPPESLVRCTTN